MAIKGSVFDIKHFSVKDGPGIRTAVFLKGCPLHCLWCHNPESQRREPELFFTPEKCVKCGQCAAVCPKECHIIGETHVFERRNCLNCGRCAAICPVVALEIAGRSMSADEVAADFLEDALFYRKSGGGVTLTGGEPMAQFEFTRALLERAKEAGIHTALDSCGFAPWSEFQEILPLTDLFLFDYKATDPAEHQRLTGVDNNLILDNLRRLDDAGAKIILRCPLIPGVNDSQAHLTRIAELTESLSGVQEITLEPYHPLGVNKSARLGMIYQLDLKDFTSKETAIKWRDFVQMKTKCKVVIS